jgi:hypothetical protein
MSHAPGSAQNNIGAQFMAAESDGCFSNIRNTVIVQQHGDVVSVPVIFGDDAPFCQLG